MSKYSNFKEFYEVKLLPDLEILDQERKQVDRRVIYIVLICLLLIIAAAKLIPANNSNVSGVIQMTLVVVGFILVSLTSKKYRLDFKSKIITKITDFADEGLAYAPEGTVSQVEFNNSAIFQKSCNSFKGEDYFQGTLGKTAIEFSEVFARHMTTSGAASKRKTHYSTIFKGVFFVADFNKHFKTHTLVLPDNCNELFGKLGQKLQSIIHMRGQPVDLEDPEFEKEFCVYADDQVEARFILSPALMQRIVAFKRKWNTKVYLSFRDSKVYIAINLKQNLFETRLFKTIVDYDFIKENIRFLELLIGIVEDLNLNTRIWTKN